MAPSNLDRFWVQGLSHRLDVITLPIAINIIALSPYGVPKSTGPKTDMNSGLCQTAPGEPLEHDEGSSMRILRFLLLLASVIGAAYIFYGLHAGTVPSPERSIVWLFGLGLVLNIIFLLFCGPVTTGTSRFSYILRLWYNAKMRELRERGSEPPRLD